MTGGNQGKQPGSDSENYQGDSEKSRVAPACGVRLEAPAVRVVRPATCNLVAHSDLPTPANLSRG